ncbi:LysR family transcriptional regulator [Sphingomonas sp.]|uniref:LysR family transcriptional regulator n=1 Tax=Sphingomonas sp. TaxID=28214 RepID=UPI0025E73373|nr:LysR family transcriptional regulator [Sphingomonas sp.]
MDRFQAMATFTRVVDSGSFTAAARQLNVGQPAVSKLIAQLEDRLGVRLLTRTTRGLAPTEAGQHYYERARRALEEADEAELAARGAGRGLSGRLRISAATTFARLHVIPRLPAFLAAHAELELEVILDDRVIDMIEENIDLSLRMGALSDSTATARKLAEGRRSVVATPAYLERAGAPRTPAELAGHEAIVYTRFDTPSWTFRHVSGSEASVRVGGRVRVSAAEGLRAAVLADMGLAVASDWMFTPELASGAVVRLLDDWHLPPLDLWALFPPGRLPTAKARAFAAFMVGAMKAG